MIDLRGQVVHVHSISTHYEGNPNLPIRCRGMALKFPDMDVVTIPVLGMDIKFAHDDTTTQEMKFIALREVLRRAKAMDFCNFSIKMQVKSKKIVESCPRYISLRAEIDQLKTELNVKFNFVNLRWKKKMSDPELLVDTRAGFASRIQYGTVQFPVMWQNDELMAQIRQQPFLPGFEESPQFIKDRLGWEMPAEVYFRYSQLGFPFKVALDDEGENDSDSDDNNDEPSENPRKRKSSKSSASASKKPAISSSLPANFLKISC